MKRNQTRLFAPEEEKGGGGGGTPPSILNSTQPQGDPPWFSNLPDDLKTPYVVQNKDLATFVKSAVDTKSLVGANTIKLPGEKATPEEIAEFYTKLGRPKEPGDYTPTVAPANETLIDPKTLDSMKAVFHAQGLSAAQGKAIIDSYLTQLNEGYTAATTAYTRQHEESVAALKQEWGDDYDANVSTAQLAIRELGSEELFAEIDSAGLGNNPLFLKFLAKVGKSLLDDSVIGKGGGAFTGTAEGSLAEIRALSLDAEFQAALNSKTHPGHAVAVERWLKLHQTAYPTKQQA